MNMLTLGKVGGVSLIAGSLLLTLYAALFPLLLPLGNGSYDYAAVVQDPDWVRLALMAGAGVLLMLLGFYAVYSRIQTRAGLLGAIGFLFIEAAYLLQACKVSWEIFLYPIIAEHAETAFLLRDAIIKHAPAVVAFRITASATIFLGIVLFCYTLYRSNEYPKAGALLLFAGALVYALGPMISVFVSVAGIFTLSIGCLLIGLRLYKVPAAA